MTMPAAMTRYPRNTLSPSRRPALSLGLGQQCQWRHPPGDAQLRVYRCGDVGGLAVATSAHGQGYPDQYGQSDAGAQNGEHCGAGDVREDDRGGEHDRQHDQHRDYRRRENVPGPAVDPRSKDLAVVAHDR